MSTKTELKEILKKRLLFFHRDKSELFLRDNV